MNPYFRRLIIYISLCLNFIFFHSINLSQNLSTQTYTFKDGLPTQAFFDAVQDTTGRMWFACKKGLTVYDGYEWKFLSEKEGVPMANYIKVKIDSKNRLWALPNFVKNRIIYKDADNWISLPAINSEYSDRITIDLAIVSEKNLSKLCVITYDSLFYFDGSIWKNETSNFPTSTRFFSLHQSQGVFYIATSRGLFTLDDNGKFQVYNIKNKNLEKVLCVLIKSNNSINDIFILSDNWLGKVVDNSIEVVVENFNIPTHLELQYYFLALDDYNNFYFGNDFSLYHYNTSETKLNSLNNSLGVKSVGAMEVFVDCEQNTWILSQRGIYKIKSSPFFSYSTADGLLSNEVSAIEENINGDIVIAHNKGFSIYDGVEFKKAPFDDYSNLLDLNSRVLDIKKNHGKIWFAASRLGFGNLSANNKIIWHTKNNSEPFFSLGKFKNNLLVSKNDTLFVLENNNLKVKQLFNQPSKIGGREIVSKKDSIILFSTNGQGIVQINGNNVSFIKSQFDNYNNTYSIYIKDDSTTLVGTVAGLCKIKGEALVEHSLDNLSISDPIYFIEAGNKPGSIWFGLDKGVIYWHEGEVRFYDPNSGLAGYETNRHAGFLDSKGNFWIGTDNGLSMFPAGNEDIPNPKPLVDILYLEDMSFQKYQLNKSIAIDHDHNSFSLHYRCLSFYDESNILFELKLVDLDGDVIEEFTTKEKSARFSNLNSGDYRISLIAKNPLGVNSYELITSTITISTAFYNQIWFYAIIAAALILIGLIIQNIYSQKLYSRKLEAEIKERTDELQNAEKIKLAAIYENIEFERKRISRDLHDYLGQILTSAKLKLEAFQHSRTIRDKQFDESIDLLQDTGKVLRIIVHNLHPLEIESYGLAASVKMNCHEINRDTKIKVNYIENNYSGKLNKKDEVMVYRIVQEALNNVIKHARCTQLSVKIEELKNKLLITVWDNGKGFNQDDAGLVEDKNNTFGLINMKQRADLLGAELEIKSEINIGTTIKLGIPLNG